MYMRVGRDPNEALYSDSDEFSVGGSKQLVSGNYAAIIATGTMVYKALAAAKELAREHIEVRVIDMYSIKPLDEAAVLRAASETKGIVTIEDHNVSSADWAAPSAKLLPATFSRQSHPSWREGPIWPFRPGGRTVHATTA